MSDFALLIGFIPEQAYKYIVLGLLATLFFRSRIPILNKIDIRVRLPEEFMRHFRWITPLMLAGVYVWMAVLYVMLKRVLMKLG